MKEEPKALAAQPTTIFHHTRRRARLSLSATGGAVRTCGGVAAESVAGQKRTGQRPPQEVAVRLQQGWVEVVGSLSQSKEI